MYFKRGKHFKTFSAAPIVGSIADDEDDDDEEEDADGEPNAEDDTANGEVPDNDADDADNNDVDDMHNVCVEVLHVCDDSPDLATTRCFLDSLEIPPQLSLSSVHSCNSNGRLDMLLIALRWLFLRFFFK